MTAEQGCRRIYRQAFNDGDTDFENRLFSLCFRYCRYTEICGEAASMLFALPCTVSTENGDENALYIYAAATDENHRGKGLMSSLISDLKSETEKLLFLVPAGEKLVGFYEKNGFLKFTASTVTNNERFVTPMNGFKTLSETEEADNFGNYLAMYYSKTVKELDGLNFNYTME